MDLGSGHLALAPDGRNLYAVGFGGPAHGRTLRRLALCLPPGLSRPVRC